MPRGYATSHMVRRKLEIARLTRLSSGSNPTNWRSIQSLNAGERDLPTWLSLAQSRERAVGQVNEDHLGLWAMSTAESTVGIPRLRYTERSQPVDQASGLIASCCQFRRFHSSCNGSEPERALQVEICEGAKHDDRIHHTDDRYRAVGRGN
jgi:hypothetical protein